MSQRLGSGEGKGCGAAVPGSFAAIELGIGRIFIAEELGGGGEPIPGKIARDREAALAARGHGPRDGLWQARLRAAVHDAGIDRLFGEKTQAGFEWKGSALVAFARRGRVLFDARSGD